VTTLGATFSTIGAKLVMTPGWIGVVPCALAENALVETHRIAPIDEANNWKILLSIKMFLPEENRTLAHSRPFLASSIGQPRWNALSLTLW